MLFLLSFDGYVRPYMLILKVGECSAIFSPHCKQTSAESYYSSLILASLLLCSKLSNMDLSFVLGLLKLDVISDLLLVVLPLLV